MIPCYDLKQFLLMISNCSGDEAIDLINRWQNNACEIAGFKMEDIERMIEND